MSRPDCLSQGEDLDTGRLHALSLMLKTPEESRKILCTHASKIMETSCWLPVPRGAQEVDGKSGQLAPCRILSHEFLHLSIRPCCTCHMTERLLDQVAGLSLDAITS